MTGRSKGNGPRAVAPATEAKVVHISRGTTPDSPAPADLAMLPSGQDDFPVGVIWEREHSRELIRFSVSEMKGHRFADLRRHYPSGDEWLPGRKGCTMPLSGLQGLYEAIGRYLAANESQGTKSAA